MGRFIRKLLFLLIMQFAGMGNGFNGNITNPTAVSIVGFEPIRDNIFIGHYKNYTYVGFRNIKLNWMLSHLKCVRHGMQLVSLQTRDEFDFIVDLLYQAEVPQSMTQASSSWGRWGFKHLAWLGINDILNEGHFTDLYTGKFFPNSSFFVSPVGARSPDNSKYILNHGENCVEIVILRRNRYGNEEVVMNDWRCNEPINLMCRFKEVDDCQNNKGLCLLQPVVISLNIYEHGHGASVPH